MHTYLVNLTSAQPTQRVFSRRVYASGPGRACSAVLAAFVDLHPEIQAGDLFISARDLGPVKLHLVEMEGAAA
jgi:hypothetical protein